MWENDNISEHGTSRRDVVCAWLLAVAVLGFLMLVTALRPIISEPSDPQANGVVTAERVQAGD